MMSNNSLLANGESVYSRADSPPAIHEFSSSSRNSLASIPYAGSTVNQPSFMDLKEAKILDLSKKNRRLTVALGKERSITESLSNKLKKLEMAQAFSTQQQETSSVVNQSSHAAVELTEEVKKLKAKMAATSRRLEEERLSNQSLRVELRHVTRSLKDEVGDDVPLNKVLGVNSGWKSRSQQITILKDRIRDLTNQLSNPFSPSSVIMDQKQKEGIKRMENERRTTIDTAISEAEQARQEKEEYRIRTEALQSRNNSLSKEIKELKSKIEILLDKSSNDDKLVTALTSELLKDKSLTKEESMSHPLSTLCHAKDVEVADLKTKIVNHEKESSSLMKRQPSPGLENGGKMNEMGVEVTVVALEGKIKALKIQVDYLTQMRTQLEDTLEGAQKESIQAKMELKRRERRTIQLERQIRQHQSSAVKRSTRSLSASQEELPKKIEELQDKLSFVEDHNEALSMMLRQTRETKEVEIRCYEDMIAELKSTIKSTVDRLCKVATR
ncbi:hypothetical protein SeLEV6574_g04033 [Synchytrium endobioticum]|uniref:Uncharacterized protein n=1 Tax=Synchytrium endobioticum TaxID=286115 RepID=A0A507D158_9FUNG|nr:hypothetical protein SeLEV6574_g04033 [Synchytrium endobioticum]